MSRRRHPGHSRRLHQGGRAGRDHLLNVRSAAPERAIGARGYLPYGSRGFGIGRVGRRFEVPDSAGFATGAWQVGRRGGVAAWVLRAPGEQRRRQGAGGRGFGVGDRDGSTGAAGGSGVGAPAVRTFAGRPKIHLAAQVERAELPVVDLIGDQWPGVGALHHVQAAVAALDDARLRRLGAGTDGQGAHPSRAAPKSTIRKRQRMFASPSLAAELARAYYCVGARMTSTTAERPLWTASTAARRPASTSPGSRSVTPRAPHDSAIMA